MNNQTTDISQRKAALVAGIGLLIMTILAIFSNFIVLGQMVVAGDAAQTVYNITTSLGIFRFGVVGFLLIVVLDVVVAWALFFLFRSTHRSISLLMAWFRIVYASIFAIGLHNLVQILRHSGNVEGLQVQVMPLLNAFNDSWDIALVLFSFHLLLLGYLAIRSGFVPRFFGILLVIAGVGYVFDSLAGFLIPGHVFTVSLVTFIGEFLFMVWLLIKGRTLQHSTPEQA